MKLFELHNNSILLEGLIKVPSDMIKKLCERIYGEYVSYMWTQTKFKDDAKKLAQKYNVKIDESFKPRNYFTEVTTIFKGLPDKIVKMWKYEFDRLDFMVDWENKYYKDVPKSNATFDEKTGQFMINPAKFKEALMDENYNIDNIISILEKVKTSMWHETSHAVQHNALKWIDKNQVGKSRFYRDNPNSTKQERRNEYLTSAVEFDPTIKTKIFDFRDKNKSSDPKEMLKELAIFVGAVLVDNKKPDEFFMALKITDLKRWKKAVKLFYQYFDFNVDKLLDN